MSIRIAAVAVIWAGFAGGLGVGACGRAEVAPAAPDAGGEIQVAARTTATAAATRAPATQAPAPKPAAPREASMSPGELDDRTLEHSPGITAPIPTVIAPAPNAAKGLEGTPSALPAMGPNDALVKVFVFSDFQCPVCRRAVEPLKKLVRQLAPDVQVIFAQNPLATHPRALPAAKAALAAFRQGKFWELHDQMFEAQSQLADADFVTHAQGLGLDMARFAKDLADPTLAAAITYQSAQAAALDLRGTPAFIVNGQKSVGWGSYIGLASQVEQARQKARALVEGGVPRADAAYRASLEADKTITQILFGAR